MTLGWHLIYARRAQHPASLAFQVGMPALDAFPEDLWGQLVARHARQTPAPLRGNLDPGGYRPLREAIASYLGWRGG